MQFVSPFMISFILILLSELGDKTQILVMSFSAKNKVTNILLGVALGTLFSHGLAILFGSKLSLIGNDKFIFYLKVLTYITFLFFGIIGFTKIKKSISNQKSSEIDSKSKIIKFLSSLSKSSVFIVASTIAIGELGDKTFLASIGLGVEYPLFKVPLICGCICGMLASDSIAIFFGKWLGTKISSSTIELLSNIVFILFGLIGVLSLFM